jgi:hypothetical protein
MILHGKGTQRARGTTVNGARTRPPEPPPGGSSETHSVFRAWCRTENPRLITSHYRRAAEQVAKAAYCPLEVLAVV